MPLRIKPVIAMLVVIILWKTASYHTNSLVLPPPEQVAKSFVGVLSSEGSWQVIRGTAQRALTGLLAASLCGILAAVALARLTPYIRPVVTTLQNIPLVSWIMLAIIWFGFTDTSVSFVVFTATLPVIYLNVAAGLSSSNPQWLEVSRNFRLPPLLKWYSIDMASVGTHISAGLSIAIAIMWKSVVMAELFVSIRGIGFAMGTSRTYLQTDLLMAWTLLLVLLGMATEYCWRLVAGSGPAMKLYRLGLGLLPLVRSPADKNRKPGGSIVINGVNKGFWQEGAYRQVLGDVTLQLNSGDTVVLTGPSGTGKTTLLRIMAGLEKPDEGQVYRHENIPCLMFQDNRLLPWFTAEENIILALLPQVPYREARGKARKMLGFLKIPGDCYPHQLSGGMQKAVSLARTLSVQSDLVLLDEPFASSDPELKRRLVDLINSQKAPAGILLIVTHNDEDMSLPTRREWRLGGHPVALTEVK